MALRQTKEFWLQRQDFYKAVFYRAAKELSEETGQRLGSLAWRRHDAEYGPDAGLQDSIRAASFLEGYYEAFFLSLSLNERARLFTIYRSVEQERGR